MNHKLYTLYIALLVGISSFGQGFNDDFAKEAINKIPSKWSVVEGDAAVALVDGKKTFALQDNALVTPKVEGTSTSYLGDEFTIEFDLFFDKAATAYRQFYKIRLWEGNGNFGFNGDNHTDPLIVYRHSVLVAGSENVKSKRRVKELEVNERGWRHIKLVYTKGSLTIFINNQELYSIRSLFYKPEMFSMEATLFSSLPLESAFTNFSLIGIAETIPDTITKMCLTSDLISPTLTVSDTINVSPNALVTAPNVLWENGATLSVSFIDTPSLTVKTNIIEFAKSWELYANVKFNFLQSGKGDIRIGLKKGGSWSYIGTTSKNIHRDSITMNFGWFNDNTDTEEFRRTTLHEFGHALGLHHEHQHPEGGICWDWDAVYDYYKKSNKWTKDETKNNLETLSNTDVGNATAYDPDSIMHYAIPESVTKCDYSTSSNKELSVMDKSLVSNLYPFRKPRHTIGPNIHNYNWTSGWDTVEFLNQGGNTYLLLLKSSTGDVHIHKMKADGSVGEKILDKKWSSGWTSAKFFKSNSTNYLFLLKQTTGDVHIHKMNTDGTVGLKVFDKKWTPGWSETQFYTVGNKTYLFLYKYQTGDVHVNKILSDGTVGDLIFDQKWTPEWTTASQFTTNNKSFMFLIKKRTGDVHINEIDANGTIGKKVFDEKWTEGWTAAEFYRTNAQSYLFLLKVTDGDAKQFFITDSGQRGEIIFDNHANWTSGWSHAKFFLVGQQNYMFLLKKDEGTVHTHIIYSN